jgi:hypothetical protein
MAAGILLMAAALFVILQTTHGPLAHKIGLA